MAKYTIYHPQHFDVELNTWVVPHTRSIIPTSYCTHHLITGLKRELWSDGHEVDIAYIPLYHVDGNPADYFHRLYIPEIDLDITVEETPFDKSLWFIVANRDTKKFCIIDMQDCAHTTRCIINSKCPNLVMSLLSMFSIERHNKHFDTTKTVPFVFTAYYPLLIQSMIEEITTYRRSLKELDNRLLFYGNTREEYNHDGAPIREVANVLKNKYPNEVDIGGWTEKLPLEDFLKKAARHRINLALPGHPWCSREHELWTLGLPVMMLEHTHAMAVDLVPNWHYIAVPGGERRSIGMAKDPEYAADQIINAHRKWITPEYEWRMNNIARNGQRRILEQVNAISIVPKLIELLQLGNW